MVRRKTTRELLAESFKDLASRKPVNKITVREITDNCSYSPATFYREFRDKYDLISWDYAREVTRIMGPVGSNGIPWNRTLIQGAHYYHDHQAYLVNLLSHTAGRESFENCLIETNFRSLQQCILRLSGQIELPQTIELCTRAYCIGTVRLCCEWLMGKFPAETADIANVWERSLPSTLAPFLYT